MTVFPQEPARKRPGRSGKVEKSRLANPTVKTVVRSLLPEFGRFLRGDCGKQGSQCYSRCCCGSQCGYFGGITGSCEALSKMRSCNKVAEQLVWGAGYVRVFGGVSKGSMWYLFPSEGYIDGHWSMPDVAYQGCSVLVLQVDDGVGCIRRWKAER